MAEYNVSSYGFYNSINNDRIYTAEKFSKVYSDIISDGIIRGWANEFAPTLSYSNWNVSIASGKAWFNDTYIICEGNTLINDIEPTIAGFHRKVAVCFQIDKKNRINTICSVFGEVVPTTSTAHEPTYLQGEDGVWQYPIIVLNVESAIDSHHSGRYSDKRGSLECPWVKFNIRNDVQTEQTVGELPEEDAKKLVITDQIKTHPRNELGQIDNESVNTIISNQFLYEDIGFPGTPYVSRGFTFRMNADALSDQDLIMGVYVPDNFSGTKCWTFSPKDKYGSTASAHYWSLGRNGAPWYDAYIDHIHTLYSVDVRSDACYKDDVKLIDNRYKDLFMKLKPKTFTFKCDDDNEQHVGFIAQEVKEAMDEVGIKTEEFGAYTDNGTNLALRYGEFIALNTMMLQSQDEQITQLQNEIENLRNRIKNLKGE